MKIKGKEKTDLEASILSTFPGSACDANAPQGQNCFSTNYILSDANSNKYLLKILLKKKIKTNINQSQATTEVSACQSINSPYVLSLVETKQNNNYIFLKFPFLNGHNLKDYANGKVFNKDEIVSIGISLLRGIADLWRKRIVHQDIKPENIFILSDGSLKILDFGSARFQVSPFSGNARTNFAYSSPEQILASRPSNIQANRITLDDRADVYAAGLILYYLIENKHPFEGESFPAESIFAGKAIPDFTRSDISKGLKRIVLQMLDINQLGRPNAQTAISYLEAGDITVPQLQNGGFYYCVINGVNRFIKMKEEMPNLFDGVVVDASQVPTKSEERNQLRNNIKTILVDPQTYLFQAPKHRSEKFKKLPFFKHERMFSDMPKLLTDVNSASQDVIDLVTDVIDYQLQVGVTAVIPPFLYIKEFNDESWSIDQEITNLSLNGILKNITVKPIVKGIAITQEILTSDQSRKRILEYLTSLSDKVEGYLVLLDSAHNEVIWDEPWLKGAQDFFIKLLSTGKYVIWNKSDFAGLVLSSTGVSIAMGEMLKQRRFNIVEDKQSYGRKVPYYYIPPLFAKATWPDALTDLASYDKIADFTCNGSCCANINFSSLGTRSEADLASHMMLGVAGQFRKYNKGTGKKNMIKDIKKAKQYFEELKNHPDLVVKEALKKTIKPSSSSFLDSWLNTLNS